MKLIIDGNGFAYRSFHSGGPIINAKGQNVTVLYWILIMLRSLINRYNTNEIIFCWDSGNPNSRLDILPSYKGNRNRHDETHELVYSQIEILKNVLPFIGIKQLWLDDTEADDVISVISIALTKNKKNPQLSTIISSDKDVLQLVNKMCDVYNPRIKQTFNIDNFEHKTGLKIEEFVDFLAINGDETDNINGVKGIGTTTIKKMINTYGSYENILKAKDEIYMLINAKSNKAFAKRIMTLFNKENEELIERNRKLVKLGYLLTIEDKKKIIESYASQNKEINENRFKSFLEEYQLLDFIRDFRNIIFQFKYIQGNKYGW